MNDDCLEHIISFIADIDVIVALLATTRQVREITKITISEIYAPGRTLHPMLLSYFPNLVSLTCCNPTILSRKLKYVHYTLPSSYTNGIVIDIVKRIRQVRDHDFTLVVSSGKEIHITFNNGILHNTYSSSMQGWFVTELTRVMSVPIQSTSTYKSVDIASGVTYPFSAPVYMSDEKCHVIQPPSNFYVCRMKYQTGTHISSLHELEEDIIYLLASGGKQISLYPPFRNMENKRKMATVLRRVAARVTIGVDVVVDVPYYPDCIAINNHKLGPNAEMVEDVGHQDHIVTDAEYHDFISFRWLRDHNLPQ